MKINFELENPQGGLGKFIQVVIHPKGSGKGEDHRGFDSYFRIRRVGNDGTEDIVSFTDTSLNLTTNNKLRKHIKERIVEICQCPKIADCVVDVIQNFI